MGENVIVTCCDKKSCSLPIDGPTAGDRRRNESLFVSMPEKEWPV